MRHGVFDVAAALQASDGLLAKGICPARPSASRQGAAGADVLERGRRGHGRGLRRSLLFLPPVPCQGGAIAHRVPGATALLRRIPICLRSKRQPSASGSLLTTRGRGQGNPFAPATGGTWAAINTFNVGTFNATRHDRG